MLAGLLFATHDADDRPDQLAATLPFAGTTLIEYQARLLVAAGAAQLVVAVSRLTPELLGALARIGRRGVAVDTVRTAAEAAARLHPLSRVMMLADGLVTTEAVARLLAGGEGELLLVTDAGSAGPGMERLGGGAAWAGAARLGSDRVREVAALPRDYDPQSALLRAAAQAGARHAELPPEVRAGGHGIERRAAVLEQRNRAVIAAAVADRGSWFDRWVVAPLARAVLPGLMRRGVGTGAIVAGAALASLTGAALVAPGIAVGGLALTLVGALAAALARVSASLRDEAATARIAHGVGAAGPAASVLLLGLVTVPTAGGAVLTAAAALVVLAALAERAAMGRRDAWWGSPPAYLAAVLAGTLAGVPLVGTAVAGAYAAATAAAAVERLRRHA